MILKEAWENLLKEKANLKILVLSEIAKGEKILKIFKQHLDAVKALISE